jgi:hypothetical protein
MIKSINGIILIENFGQSDYGGNGGGGPVTRRLKKFGAAAISPMGLAVGGTGVLIGSSKVGKSIGDTASSVSGNVGKFFADLHAKRSGGSFKSVGNGEYSIVDNLAKTAGDN